MMSKSKIQVLNVIKNTSICGQKEMPSKPTLTKGSTQELYYTFMIAEHLHAGLCVWVVGRLEAEFGNA